MIGSFASAILGCSSGPDLGQGTGGYSLVTVVSPSVVLRFVDNKITIVHVLWLLFSPRFHPFLGWSNATPEPTFAT
jgi:hypothetical protein